MSDAEQARAVREQGHRPGLTAYEKRDLLAQLAGLSAKARRNPAVLTEVWEVRRLLDWGCRPVLSR